MVSILKRAVHSWSLGLSRPAPFSSRPDASRGRLFREADSRLRTAFQRDRDRVIHSTAFRRLKHKTQVFVAPEGDHYRTRLTHSLEVAQIARSIARCLGLDEDLAEAVALAHDLGHTPFGHAGEEALDQAMADWGGFDHNAQTLRILTKLEQRYAEFDGLNLSWETLEGVVKHNGPLTGPLADAKKAKPVPVAITEYVAQHDLGLDTFAGPEAQVAALSDDIAYDNHDIDDGLRAGLFGIADLRDVPLVGPVFAEVEAKYPGLAEGRLIGESIRRLIGIMVEDVIAETRRRIEKALPRSADAVRGLSQPLVAFSEPMRAQERVLRQFLFEHMYKHERVLRTTDRARDIVRDLFSWYMAEPATRLPAEWRARVGGKSNAGTARVVSDYIAGMTDRFALDEHRRIFGSSSGL
jgi:dGTPase